MPLPHFDPKNWTPSERIEEKTFNVPGAGSLYVSDSATHTTGGVEGFSIAVSWGRHGRAPGVLSKEEALRLAQHIMRTLNLEKLLDDGK